LREMIASNQRLVVLTSNLGAGEVGCNGAHPSYPWLHSEWSVAFETPYTYNVLRDVGRGNPNYCRTDRGDSASANTLSILNNFDTPPSYITAADVNGYTKVLDSAQYCHDIRADHRWPNFIAVDFENCDDQYTCTIARGHDGIPDIVLAANAINASFRP